MFLERKELLSAYYFVKDMFASSDFITVVKGFPNKLLTLPTVSVDWEYIESSPFEIGNRTQLKEVKYNFNVFALNTDQRDELIFKIFNELDMGISVYDYDMGFPPLVSPTKLGCLVPLRKNARNIPVLAQLTEELYYRASIVSTLVYDKL